MDVTLIFAVGHERSDEFSGNRSIQYGTKIVRLRFGLDWGPVKTVCDEGATICDFRRNQMHPGTVVNDAQRRYRKLLGQRGLVV